MRAARYMHAVVFALWAWAARSEAQAPEPTAAASAYISADAPDDTKVGNDPDLAKALFIEAKELRERGEVAAACDKLRESLSRNPSVASLLNLGRCHRELGKLVTAHDYYRRAERLATLKGDEVRQDLAHDEAAKLAPLRATLWLQISEADLGRLEVRIDDVPQPPDIWTHPMYLDAGEHSISIRAPEREPYRDHVRVQDGVRAVLVVPDLQRLPASPLKAAEPPSPPSSLVSPEIAAFREAHRSSPPGLGTGRVSALVVGGVGIVSLAVGLLFGQLAKSANDRSQKLCRDTTQVCSPEGVGLREDAFTHATRSTVLSITGAVAIASGVTIWLASPAPDLQPQPVLALRLSPHQLGAQLRGNF